MRFIVLPLGFVLGLALLTGCGAASRRYTVRQVEQAFAAEQVSLHRATTPDIPGYVVLRRGTKSDFITVWVETVRPEKGPALYLAGSRGERGDHVTERGNLIVANDPSNASAVSAALAKLR